MQNANGNHKHRIRWNHGQLGWHDPETGDHIVRYEDLEARADAAEARARELEAEMERRRQGWPFRPSPWPQAGDSRTKHPSGIPKVPAGRKKCQQPKKAKLSSRPGCNLT